MIRGVIFALLANLLFGVGFYFAVLLRPLSSENIFAFRIIILLPVILLAILLFKQQRSFMLLCKKVQKNHRLLWVILLLTLNTGVQLWLFMWAPNNGQALQVSIGYLLLPIVTVAIGKIVFKEYFSPLKWWALFFAVVGVTVNILTAEAISWATFVAGFGYPIYIALRRYFQINNLATFFVELILLLPLALYLLRQVNLNDVIAENHDFYRYLVLFGIVNGLAFILFISSSNRLPINVLGLLGYVEPLVMLFIAFAIGEVLEAKSYILMIALLIAIVLLTVDNFRRAKLKK
ncbi:permease [Pasteurellaceae bacterium Macca]|nr:permease [Pasteurellaceae bacterium Macca]